MIPHDAASPVLPGSPVSTHVLRDLARCAALDRPYFQEPAGNDRQSPWRLLVRGRTVSLPRGLVDSSPVLRLLHRSRYLRHWTDVPAVFNDATTLQLLVELYQSVRGPEAPSSLSLDSDTLQANGPNQPAGLEHRSVQGTLDVGTWRTRLGLDGPWGRDTGSYGPLVRLTGLLGLDRLWQVLRTLERPRLVMLPHEATDLSSCLYLQDGLDTTYRRTVRWPTTVAPSDYAAFRRALEDRSFSWNGRLMVLFRSLHVLQGRTPTWSVENVRTDDDEVALVGPVAVVHGTPYLRTADGQQLRSLRWHEDDATWYLERHVPVVGSDAGRVHVYAAGPWTDGTALFLWTRDRRLVRWDPRGGAQGQVLAMSKETWKWCGLVPPGGKEKQDAAQKVKVAGCSGTGCVYLLYAWTRHKSAKVIRIEYSPGGRTGKTLHATHVTSTGLDEESELPVDMVEVGGRVLLQLVSGQVFDTVHGYRQVDLGARENADLTDPARIELPHRLVTVVRRVRQDTDMTLSGSEWMVQCGSPCGGDDTGPDRYCKVHLLHVPRIRLLSTLLLNEGDDNPMMMPDRPEDMDTATELVRRMHSLSHWVVGTLPYPATSEVASSLHDRHRVMADEDWLREKLRPLLLLVARDGLRLVGLRISFPPHRVDTDSRELPLPVPFGDETVRSASDPFSPDGRWVYLVWTATTGTLCMLTLWRMDLQSVTWERLHRSDIALRYDNSLQGKQPYLTSNILLQDDRMLFTVRQTGETYLYSWYLDTGHLQSCWGRGLGLDGTLHLGLREGSVWIGSSTDGTMVQYTWTDRRSADGGSPERPELLTHKVVKGPSTYDEGPPSMMLRLANGRFLGLLCDREIVMFPGGTAAPVLTEVEGGRFYVPSSDFWGVCEKVAPAPVVLSCGLYLNTGRHHERVMEPGPEVAPEDGSWAWYRRGLLRQLHLPLGYRTIVPLPSAPQGPLAWYTRTAPWMVRCRDSVDVELAQPVLQEHAFLRRMAEGSTDPARQPVRCHVDLEGDVLRVLTELARQAQQAQQAHQAHQAQPARQAQEINALGVLSASQRRKVLAAAVCLGTERLARPCVPSVLARVMTSPEDSKQATQPSLWSICTSHDHGPAVHRRLDWCQCPGIDHQDSLFSAVEDRLVLVHLLQSPGGSSAWSVRTHTGDLLTGELGRWADTPLQPPAGGQSSYGRPFLLGLELLQGRMQLLVQWGSQGVVHWYESTGNDLTWNLVRALGQGTGCTWQGPFSDGRRLLVLRHGHQPELLELRRDRDDGTAPVNYPFPVADTVLVASHGTCVTFLCSYPLYKKLGVAVITLGQDGSIRYDYPSGAPSALLPIELGTGWWSGLLPNATNASQTCPYTLSLPDGTDLHLPAGTDRISHVHWDWAYEPSDASVKVAGQQPAVPLALSRMWDSINPPSIPSGPDPAVLQQLLYAPEPFTHWKELQDAARTALGDLARALGLGSQLDRCVRPCAVLARLPTALDSSLSLWLMYRSWHPRPQLVPLALPNDLSRDRTLVDRLALTTSGDRILLACVQWRQDRTLIVTLYQGRPTEPWTISTFQYHGQPLVEKVLPSMVLTRGNRLHLVAARAPHTSEQVVYVLDMLTSTVEVQCVLRSSNGKDSRVSIHPGSRVPFVPGSADAGQEAGTTVRPLSIHSPVQNIGTDGDRIVLSTGSTVLLQLAAGSRPTSSCDTTGRDKMPRAGCAVWYKLDGIDDAVVADGSSHVCSGARVHVYSHDGTLWRRGSPGTDDYYLSNTAPWVRLHGSMRHPVVHDLAELDGRPWLLLPGRLVRYGTEVPAKVLLLPGCYDRIWPLDTTVVPATDGT